MLARKVQHAGEEGIELLEGLQRRQAGQVCTCRWRLRHGRGEREHAGRQLAVVGEQREQQRLQRRRGQLGEQRRRRQWRHGERRRLGHAALRHGRRRDERAEVLRGRA
jgi:hypothetical protein